MKNIICKNCSAANPFYELICHNCKAYIRERIVNIDLWKTLADLTEAPSKGFASIIHAEHKNFIFFICIFAALKLLINVMLISPVTAGNNNPFAHFIRNYFIVLALLIFLFTLFSLAQKYLLRLLNINTRFKDNFAVTVYSFVPHIFGLVILFTIEMVIFGGFLFSNNPSPFILKETIAYTLLVFELLIILWQLALITTAFFVVSGKILIALLFSLIFNTLLYYILYLFSYLII